MRKNNDKLSVFLSVINVIIFIVVEVFVSSRLYSYYDRKCDIFSFISLFFISTVIAIMHIPPIGLLYFWITKKSKQWRSVYVVFLIASFVYFIITIINSEYI